MVRADLKAAVTMRSNTLDAARRAYLNLVRGTVHQVNDKPKMQTVDARLLHNELLTGIERMQEYGLNSLPPPPDPNSPKAGELIVGFLHGNRSHPIAIATDDRRYRPTNGESGQVQVYHFKGHSLKLTTAGYTYDAGSNKMPHLTTVGTGNVKVEDGKVTCWVNKTKLIVTDGKILFGDDSASIPVMIQSGPSTLLFSTS